MKKDCGQAAMTKIKVNAALLYDCSKRKRKIKKKRRFL